MGAERTDLVSSRTDRDTTRTQSRPGCVQTGTHSPIECCRPRRGARLGALLGSWRSSMGPPWFDSHNRTHRGPVVGTPAPEGDRFGPQSSLWTSPWTGWGLVGVRMRLRAGPDQRPRSAPCRVLQWCCRPQRETRDSPGTLTPSVEPCRQKDSLRSRLILAETTDKPLE